jgi:hypothetical protein
MYYFYYSTRTSSWSIVFINLTTHVSCNYCKERTRKFYKTYLKLSERPTWEDSNTPVNIPWIWEKLLLCQDSQKVSEKRSWELLFSMSVWPLHQPGHIFVSHLRAPLVCFILPADVSPRKRNRCAIFLPCCMSISNANDIFVWLGIDSTLRFAVD